MSTPPNSLRAEVSRPCPARYKKLHSTSTEDKQLTTDLNRLKAQIKFDENLEKNKELLQQHLHQQRLKNLKDISSKLKDDSWKYSAPNTEVEKLLTLYK
jgi:hypothetical protein